MVMPRDLFEAQMAHLARHFSVLPLPEAVRLLERGMLPRRAVAVTFDDGYADNYDHAWPILRKYGIPATIFLVTGALDRKAQLWWDEVIEDVQRLARHPLPQRENGHTLPDWLVSLLDRLCGDADPRAAALDMVRRMNSLSRQEQRQSLDVLSGFASSSPNDRPDVMLTWEQVSEMHRSGISFGSHTITHAVLDELDDEEAQQEIEGSIERLQEKLEAPVGAFAYPRGLGASRARRLLERAGIEAAVTTEPGRNEPGTDLLGLKRLDAGYFRLDGGFDPAVLEVEVQGWFNRFRHGPIGDLRP
jgi:peptidoglycan/xylan/chitin deacetylase (PgdA/CDA1 family)